MNKWQALRKVGVFTFGWVIKATDPKSPKGKGLSVEEISELGQGVTNHLLEADNSEYRVIFKIVPKDGVLPQGVES